MPSADQLNKFRPDIEGLRALAVLMVVAFHASVPGFDGGFIGVDVFFVISGYLISGLLVAEREKTGSINLIGFYARRIRRLLPAAFLVFLATLSVGMFVLSPVEQDVLGRTARAVSVYLGNVWFYIQGSNYFGEDLKENPLLHTWSLAVEEQFYLVWPLIIIFALAKSQSRQLLFFTFLAISAASYVLSIYLTSISQPFAFYLLPGRAWEFALGATVRFLPGFWRQGQETWPLGLASTSFALLVLCLSNVIEMKPFPGSIAGVPALATALLLYALANGEAKPFRTALSNPISIWIGRLSYSWYLWHWPVLVYLIVIYPESNLTVRVTASFFALILAAVTYFTIENPMRRSSYLRHRNIANISGGIAITFIGVSLAWEFRNHAEAALALPEQQSILQVKLAQHPLRQSCHVESGPDGPFDCIVGDKNGDKTIVLFGDSHAFHWLPGLEIAGAEKGWRVISMTRTGCPSVDAMPYYRILPDKGSLCMAWREAAIEQILAINPQLVVLSNSVQALRLKADEDGDGPDLDGWKAAHIATFSILQKAEIKALLLHDAPQPGKDIVTCLSRALRAGREPDVCDFGANVPLLEASRGAELAAAAQFELIEAVDLGPEMCRNNLCKAKADGIITYSDDDHLSLDWSKNLAPLLSIFIEKALQGIGLDEYEKMIAE